MISLVFCGDIKYCPYITRYIERCKTYNVEYEVIFWNRSGDKLNSSENYVVFEETSDLGKNKCNKAYDFVRFRNWLKKYVDNNKRNRYVLLSSLTGILIANYLSKHNIDYIFDIRDYSYESIRLYYKIEEGIIRRSYQTVISSRGFINFLPQNYDYIIAHNFNRNDIVPGIKMRKKEEVLQFVWNGMVRYFDFQRQYILALKNDSRFQIVYHGDGPELEMYKQFCFDNHVNNVYFTGAYNNSDKFAILKDASILNNCYGYIGNAGNKLKYAVSNRFYDGVIFHIPQLVEQEGYKTEWAQKSEIGRAITLDDHFADSLYKYYWNLDSKQFDRNCEKFIREVICEDDRFIKSIDDFIANK